MINYKIIALFGLVLLVGFLFVETGLKPVSTRAKTATVYKSPNCGCCVNYISYLKQNGFKVEVVNTEDRSEFNVPKELASCHTTIIGDQIAEGHIPIENIEDMMKKDIYGIALAGMPSGSPGMPGIKKGEFNIQEIPQKSQKESKIKKLLAQGEYACCLEKPCFSCFELDPWHGKGESCHCLDDLVNGVHPCGECIGGILSGRGNPLLKPYFAPALAEEVGQEYLETLEKIINEKYD